MRVPAIPSLAALALLAGSADAYVAPAFSRRLSPSTGAFRASSASRSSTPTAVSSSSSPSSPEVTDLAYSLDPPDRVRLGLIVLQADATLETELPDLTPAGAAMHVTRVPSGLEVSTETLAEMSAHIPAAALLLPRETAFAAVAYACTSGAAVIGRAEVAALVRRGVQTDAVTDPASALIAACGALGVSRLGLISPYVAEVSDRLRWVLADAGIETPVLGSFNIAEEEKVVRISAASVQAAAEKLAAAGGVDVDALFLSCTNLRTLSVIEPLEAATGLPVLSSNLVLGWHLARLAGLAPTGPGRLVQAG